MYPQSSERFFRKTGYVFEELYMWHDPGSISFSRWVQPGETWENESTKRRIHNLIVVSGVYDLLVKIKARTATKDELLLFHTEEYHNKIAEMSLLSKGGDGGEQCRFAQGGYDLAALSAGGLLAAVEAVLHGKIENAYCLIRPPGHHALADKGMGFCIFNNIVIAAKHAKKLNLGIERVAIVDYDVHHGNGTQAAFWNDPDILFISLHQDNNYPQGVGSIDEIGGENARGTNINIPLPPGSGSGAYLYAFSKVVVPALEKFKPDLILVSSGFDASYADRLGAMMLSSEAFKQIAAILVDSADKLCHGRVVFAHEGGYSPDYVPFCGLAVIEALLGIKSAVEDPYLTEVRQWGYQALQPHQKAVIDAVASLIGLHSFEDTTESDKEFSSSEIIDVDVYNAIEKLLSLIPNDGRRQRIIEKIIK